MTHKKNRDFKRIINKNAFDLRKEQMLADLDPLIKKGVEVKDCGENGLQINNFKEGIDDTGAYIIDKSMSLEKVHPGKRGYVVFSEDKKNIYLRPEERL